MAVLRADSDRVVFFAHRERATQLLADGAVKVEGNFLRLSGARVAQTDARPGSFGIRRQHMPVGREYGLSAGVVFSHQENLHDGFRRQASV